MDYQDDLTARRREALWRQLGVHTQQKAITLLQAQLKSAEAQAKADEAVKQVQRALDYSRRWFRPIRKEDVLGRDDDAFFTPRAPLTQLTPRRQEELEESFACYRVDQRQRDTLPAAMAFVLIGVVALLWMFW